ncbi:Uncharacterised protein [Vibrio cholerae]|nr:Uncharacterised protein [Vibrio cholerae]
MLILLTGQHFPSSTSDVKNQFGFCINRRRIKLHKVLTRNQLIDFHFMP